MRSVWVLLTILVLTGPVVVCRASEDPCHQTGEHTRLSYFLVDRTDHFENTDSFTQSMGVVKESIEPGERLIIGASTGSMGTTRVLLDTVLPAKSMWVSNMKYRSLKKKFFACIDKVGEELLQEKEEHKKSALLETLKFVRDVLVHDKVPHKRLFLYSDMVQNSGSLSFFPLPSFAAAKMFERTKKKGMVWNMSGVTVAVAGLGQSSQDAYSLELEKYWKSYFKEAHAKLDFIGPVLVK